MADEPGATTVEAEELSSPREEVAPPVPPRRRRPLQRRTRIGLIVVGVIAVVAAVLLIANWMNNTASYVSTDNAQVDGTQILINAPSSGTLVDWKASMGSQVTAQEPVGRIAIQTGYMQPEMIVRAPADGVVAVNNGVDGAFVTAGTQLAIAYNEAGVFVTARVDETAIDEVHVGQAVDITVDAFPNTTLTGRVSEIKTGAAGVFSLFPQSNTTGNFQKVTQVIPVKVSIDDREGLQLVPGMNVTVRIHRK